MVVVKCELCGMSYVPQVPDNVREHSRYHDRIVNGFPTRPLKSDCVIWAEADSRITLVNPRSVLPQRRRAEEVARLARRDMPYGEEDLFNGKDTHAFFLHKRNRAIGFLSIEKQKHVWKACWADLDAGKEPEEIVGHPPIWSICMAWIHERHRGSGLGQFMVSQAAVYLGCDLGSVGWYTPFTESGRNLVRKCCPETFYIAK
jgi:hypothetical protein